MERNKEPKSTGTVSTGMPEQSGAKNQNVQLPVT